MKTEYIVDQTLAPEVLTNDVDFSFEKGTLMVCEFNSEFI